MDDELKELLKSMQNDMRTMNQRIGTMDQRTERLEENVVAIGQRTERLEENVVAIGQRTERLEENLQSLKADNAKLVTLEQKVDLILEGQQGINEKFQKLDELAESVEDIKITVNAMESITKQNCTDIKQLRKIQ